MTRPPDPSLREGWIPAVTRRRLRLALKLLVLFGLAPVLVGSFLGPRGAGAAALLGTVLTVATVSLNGPAAGRIGVPLVTAAALLGSWSKPGWPWVAVVVGFGVLSGLATRRGYGVAVAQATMMAVVVPSAPDVRRLFVVALFVALGATYGLVMTTRLGGRVAHTAPPASRRFAYISAAALGLALAVAGALVVVMDWRRGTWLVSGIVVLGVPTPGLTERLMIQRLLGQLAACAVVVGVGVASHEALTLNVGAVIALVCYLMALDRPGVRPIMWFSVAAMLPTIATTSETVLVVQRLAFSGLGVVILVFVLMVVRRFVPVQHLPPSSPPAEPEISSAAS